MQTVNIITPEEAEVGNIFYLDLDRYTLYLYEQHKSIEVIDALVRGIEQQDFFMPVPVCRMSDKKFSLVLQGHHRAVAHYITRTPLRVTLENISFFKEENPPYLEAFHRQALTPKDIILVSDPDRYDWVRDLHPEYR